MPVDHPQQQPPTEAGQYRPGPDYIYLQGENGTDGRSWCADRIEDDDTPYIRLDLHQSQLSAAQADNAASDARQLSAIYEIRKLVEEHPGNAMLADLPGIVRDKLKRLEGAEAKVAFYGAREKHFADALGVADGGRYRADWDSAIRRVLMDRDQLREQLEEAEAGVKVWSDIAEEARCGEVKALNHRDQLREQLEQSREAENRWRDYARTREVLADNLSAEIERVRDQLREQIEAMRERVEPVVTFLARQVDGTTPDDRKFAVYNLTTLYVGQIRQAAAALAPAPADAALTHPEGEAGKQDHSPDAGKKVAVITGGDSKASAVAQAIWAATIGAQHGISKPPQPHTREAVEKLREKAQTVVDAFVRSSQEWQRGQGGGWKDEAIREAMIASEDAVSSAVGDLAAALIAAQQQEGR